MNEYTKVSVTEYVNQGLINGKLIPQVAVKFARILAREGIVGEEIITWSEDNLGQPIVEKTATVGENQYVVTKADNQGNPIIDKHNNNNQWIMDESVFTSKYELDPSIDGLFKPKGSPQTFVQIPDNIILEQWGEEMKIAAGGYINITNPNDMYGISARDFESTYKFIEEKKKLS